MVDRVGRLNLSPHLNESVSGFIHHEPVIPNSILELRTCTQSMAYQTLASCTAGPATT